MNFNIQLDENGNVIPTDENMDLLKVRGTRSLMENLQNVMKSGNLVKDAEIVPPSDDLINPRTKFGNGSGDSSLGGDDDIDFEIEDEIFD